MNIAEFADLLEYRSHLPAEAIEALAEYAGIGICNLNLKTGDIDLNSTITRLTGYEPGELPHTENTKFMLTLDEDIDIVKNAMTSLMSGKIDRYYIEYRMKRKDSSFVSVGEYALVLERDGNGTPVHICTLDQDLSRVRLAEDKARRIERENMILVRSSDSPSIANRNRMLRATNAAARVIIGGFHQDYETVLKQALQILAESTYADKAYIMRNTVRDEKMCFFPRAVWDKETSPEQGSAEKEISTYDDFYPNWLEEFSEGFSIRAKIEDLPPSVKTYPLIQNARSVMFAPLYLQGDFFGMLCFENRHDDQVFSEDDADIMVAGTLILASSIARNETFQQLNKAKDAAVSGTKAKGEFISQMSHEIRTPINAIIGMNTLAKKTDDPEAIRHYLDMIDVSSRQLLSLINDILDMSKIESGKFEIISGPFDFNEMLGGVINVINVKCEEKSQHLIVNVENEIGRELIGDELRLSQVLINLLNNAAKFTPERGTITLTVAEKAGGTRLRMSVEDTGIGISEENQKNLFQVFEQTDGHITKKYGGSGLGLSICKKIVELMDGVIWAESEEGKGSLFAFEIPVTWGKALRKREVFYDNKRPATSAAVKNDSPEWNEKTILLVEDIDVNREIVAGMLAETGVNLIFAEDGVQAIDIFSATPDKFDLILMDMQMPNMDGLTATKLIRKMDVPSAQSIPILAMTANAFKEDVDACLAAGMNAHIAKPIGVDDLIRTVEAYFS